MNILIKKRPMLTHRGGVGEMSKMPPHCFNNTLLSRFCFPLKAYRNNHYEIVLIHLKRSPKR
jgi:hypothetical protein